MSKDLKGHKDPSKLKNIIKKKDNFNYRQARLDLRQELREDKKNYKNKYQEYQKKGIDVANNELVADKQALKDKSKLYRKYKRNDHTRLTNKLKSGVITGAKLSVQQEALQSLKNRMRDDDNLAAGLDLKEKMQRARGAGRSAKGIGKAAGRIGLNTGELAYNTANRTKNLMMGRGFHKTPVSLRQKALRKLQRRMALLSKRFGRTAKTLRGVKKGFSGLFNGVRWIGQVGKAKVYIPLLLLALLLVVFMGTGGQPGLKQTNQKINDTWTHMTWLDAQNNDTSHQYYTNWAPYMFYTNELWGDFNPNDVKLSLDNRFHVQNYPAVLNNLWQEVHKNGNEYSLDDFMAGKSSGSSSSSSNQNTPYYVTANPWKLSDEEHSEEQVSQNEIGFQILGNQLQAPFDTDVINISRRMGYEKVGDAKTATMNNTTTIEVPDKGPLKAPMGGQLTVVNNNTITIENANQSKLTLTGIAPGHVNGDVGAGDYIGAATGDHLDLVYSLYDDDQDNWFNANPGFYFPKVNYLQFTSVADDNFDPSAGKIDRAKELYKFFTKQGFKLPGIAAVLGNFDYESAIQPKRAEGDYLNPPVGKHDNSYDDENWLNMGGAQIYNGRFPNIIHRGLGLGQWTDVAPGPGGRHTMLIDYAKSKNKKWYDLDLQLDFMINGDDRTGLAKNILSSSSTDVQGLTMQFLQQWEGNTAANANPKGRVDDAMSWYKYFSNPDNTKDSNSDSTSNNNATPTYVDPNDVDKFKHENGDN